MVIIPIMNVFREKTYVKEKNGDEYQQLTSNLSADYDGIFANKADIVMTIAVEKNIDENKHVQGSYTFLKRLLGKQFV